MLFTPYVLMNTSFFSGFFIWSVLGIILVFQRVRIRSWRERYQGCRRSEHFGC